MSVVLEDSCFPVSSKFELTAIDGISNRSNRDSEVVRKFRLTACLFAAMDQIEERKLKEPFELKRTQCDILLNGLVKMCDEFKKFQELECTVLDDELAERIQALGRQVVEADSNLKHTIECISSAAGEMQEEFNNFVVNEDQEAYYPSFQLQLKEDVSVMNNQESTVQQIDANRRLVNIQQTIRELQQAPQENEEEDVDFAEINTQQLEKIPIDPFTQKEIEIPVVNKKCKHVYDKSSITNYLNQRAKSGRTGQCPQIGCLNRNVTFNDLVEDKELKEKIDRIRHNM